MESSAKEKVAVFVCNDLMGLLILNRIVPSMKEIGYEPVVFNTGLNRNRDYKVPTPPVVAFFNAALPTEVIIPTLESQPVTKAPNYTFRQLADLHNVEYREIEDVNDPALINEIAGDEQYKGGIAARFLQVFEREIIGVFHEKGFLWNLHSGLLPYYKGLLTPYRAIMNGEKTYGMTIHDLTCGIDEGDIILKGELPLDRSKPVLDLYLDTVSIGADLILKGLATYKKDGIVPCLPQTGMPKQGYYTNPTSEEFRTFAANGIIYADPQNAVERLTDLFGFKDTALHASLQQRLQESINGILHKPTQILRPAGTPPQPALVHA